MNQTVYTSKFYLVKPLGDNVQNNNVTYPSSSYHTWTNQRGYGNIVVATNNVENTIVGSIHPWNRLPPLESPFDTFVRIESAWSTKPMDCPKQNPSYQYQSTWKQ
jgi:hypothetical protein